MGTVGICSLPTIFVKILNNQKNIEQLYNFLITSLSLQNPKLSKAK